MDFISRTWVHPLCYDEQLTAEFLSQNWTWYTLNEDAAGNENSEPISPNLLSDTLEDDAIRVAVTAQYHLWHCSFAWRKLHRAVLGNGRVDSYLANENHTHHCSGVGLTPLPDPDEITTLFTVKYTTCGGVALGR